MAGHNVQVTETKDAWIVTLKKTAPVIPSKSGKSDILATTGGNITLSDGTKLGVNAYRPRPVSMGGTGA